MRSTRGDGDEQGQEVTRQGGPGVRTRVRRAGDASWPRASYRSSQRPEATTGAQSNMPASSWDVPD
ncbi:hypothetical protein VSH64_04710 [Amycolatopsis rhabdoformis]|uniref:Uncharacterized protein n=1 Tax=Amycolatopsis rhabdoformis TaxID=1448059 RepID=A0ABZ1IAB4_9PSEU|nr:hypothetical protein [Amycolatopsis rhabdoformis]WSE31410.1 hypothetical protein VSH64_04710 [Amycolatopsis rhabdoformis]